MANETQVICKNIFKSGNEKDSKEEFTKRWIELINQREKNKGRTVASVDNTYRPFTALYNICVGMVCFVPGQGRMNMTNLKVGIYCRLSEEDRNKQSETDDSASIQNQKSMLIQYALEQGWEIYNIYRDDDYTGADRNRPEFKKLLEDAKKRRIDIVLCKTQSRFTRELELVEKYIHGLFPI